MKPQTTEGQAVGAALTFGAQLKNDGLDSATRHAAAQADHDPDVLWVYSDEQHRPIFRKSWSDDADLKSAYGSVEAHHIETIEDLQRLMIELQDQPHRCTIAGHFVGHDAARGADVDVWPAKDGLTARPKYKPGLARKSRQYWHDAGTRIGRFDIDGAPCGPFDPIADPDGAWTWLIENHFPPEIADADFILVLSSSAGRPSKAPTELRGHLYCLLENAVPLARLQALAEDMCGADTSTFNPERVMICAAPDTGGLPDPYAGRRVLLLRGSRRRAALPPWDGADEYTQKAHASRRFTASAGVEPWAQAIIDAGKARGPYENGKLPCFCPFGEAGEHGEGKFDKTVFIAPRGFKCFAPACTERKAHDFFRKFVENGISETPYIFQQATGAADDNAPQATPGLDTLPQVDLPDTDAANARRLITLAAGRMLFASGTWVHFEGTRWKADEHFPHRLAAKVQDIAWDEAKVLREESRRLGDYLMEQRSDRLFKWAQRSGQTQTISAAVAYARHHLAVDAADFDRNPMLFACVNGTIDLRTGQLRSSNASDRITKLSPVAYDPDAKSELWERTVERIAGGPELAAFLQRWFGYCATGHTREQAFAVHFGAGGNGKSLVFETLSAVMGDHAGAAAPNLLIVKPGNTHPTGIADLRGLRMVTAHENSDGAVLDEGFVKQATGGDRLKARLMSANFFEFEPTHKLQLLTNQRPIIHGTDAGLWRRVLLVPYNIRFGTPEEVQRGEAQFPKDTTLMECLKGELPGVLAWAVRGALEWQRIGLQPPDAVLAATREYRTESDRVGTFVAECCELSRDAEAIFNGPSASLYQAYRTWAQGGGYQALGKGRFQTEISRLVPSARWRDGKLPGPLRQSVKFIGGIRLA